MTAGGGPEDVSFVDVVRALTQVARRRDSRGEPIDFADFIARVLAATGANVGGPDQMLAGRTGSWEASCLAALMQGTVGDQHDDWRRFRTEPLVVPLNVAELIERGDRHPGLAGLDDATAAIEVRYALIHDDVELDACDSQIDAVAARYVDAYRAYGERFTEAVCRAAEDLGLPVSVTVDVDHDPQSDWWADSAISNPAPYDGDELVFQLWSEAHDVVPLPNVDVRLERP